MNSRLLKVLKTSDGPAVEDFTEQLGPEAITNELLLLGLRTKQGVNLPTVQAYVAIDADLNQSLPSGYEVYIDGGRTPTGSDAIELAKKIDGYGASTILPTSKNTDGVKIGYDLPLISKIKKATSAQIVASGGAGTLEHFYQGYQAGATILLAASVFHFQTISISDLKQYLKERDVPVQWGSEALGTG